MEPQLPMEPVVDTESDRRTKVVYGETFARYDRRLFLEFLRPLERRLEVNGISTAVFRGQRCLDAGCGGGRGTVLMARAGADKVIAFDLSEQNIETTTRNAALFDLDNVETVCGSLLDLPYPDETFDVVWCNGVVHHTVKPDRAMQEITRVLRVGGRLWLYLYGSGGIYWFMVDALREWLADIDMHECMSTLARLGTPTDRIAEFMDDWYVPHLKRYVNEDVVARLRELGFTATPRPLEGGMTYDTSVRRADVQQRGWMGEGDLRYWVAKSSVAVGRNEHPLPDVDGTGSAYTDVPEVHAFRAHFEALTRASAQFARRHPKQNHMRRISIAAQLQTWLRDSFSGPEPFSGHAFAEQIAHHVAAFETRVLERD